MRWTDADLDMIFSVLPTEENAIRLGKVMGRTAGSIELTWRFSSSTKKKNMVLGSRRNWAERCRKAKVRNGWKT